MKNNSIPKLSYDEMSTYLLKAADSPRRRYPKILHQPGDEFNQVYNFMMDDTYMQPHLHPGKEKIEKMYLIKGIFAVIYFDDHGEIEKVTHLEHDVLEYIKIPAFTWHTYVMLTDNVVTYETMMGKFDPRTWKTLADWAPEENSHESQSYLEVLKEHVKGNLY